MNNVLKFISDNKSEYSLNVPRTEGFNEITEELSNFISAISLNQPDNDRLVELIVRQISETEHGAYLAGFDMGIKIMKSLESKDGGIDMEKLYFEMTQAEAELTHIGRNLEFAQFCLSVGFDGESNGRLSVEEINELAAEACVHLEGAIRCVNQLTGAYKDI